jgi:hypothetical protein
VRACVRAKKSASISRAEMAEQGRTGCVMALGQPTGGTRRTARNPATSAEPGYENAQPRTVGR